MNSSRNSKKKWLQIKCLEMAYKGYNYREISETMHISLGKISQILSEINQNAKQEIKGWIDHVTPYEYKKSLLLLEFIMKKASEIVETTLDERTCLQALSVMEQTDQAKRSLLSDTHVINMAISRIEKNKLDEMKQRVEEKLDQALAEDNKAKPINTTKPTNKQKRQAKETVF